MRWLAVVLLFALPGLATTKQTDPSPAEIDHIIKSFAANEAAFATAREQYTYRQTVKLQEFDEVDTPHGRFELVSDIIFDKNNKRTERIVRAPSPTLRLITMSPEDEQDLRHVLPFVLTTTEIDQYHVRYLGRQMADEVPCFVFAVKPKQMQPGKRYFTGQIWVDDRDLMIVKTYGRSAGLLKKGSDQQFPKFETYRSQVDGKYWFPIFTTANSTLNFESGQRVRVKMTVRYDDYKVFGATSDIKVVSEDVIDEPQK